jgi:hypothetical protein
MKIKINIEKGVKLLNYAIILSLFFSCDPIYKAFDFENNTNDTIYMNYFFIKDSIIKFPLFHHEIRIIPPKKELTLMNGFAPLDADFNWTEKKLKDSTLEIVVFEDNPIKDTTEFENNPLIFLNKYFFAGKYWVKPYTYDELKEKKFKVVFPDDGFVRGKPVKLYNAYEVIETTSE